MVHVNTPAVSRLSSNIPLMTPLSARLSVPSAGSSALKSRTSSTVKSQSSVPLCGDSFFEHGDADHSHINWSDFSSFDESNIEPFDAPLVPLNSKVRSHQVTAAAAGSSMCSVQRSQSEESSSFTAASLTCSSSNTLLTSRQPNSSQISSLPTPGVHRQKPCNTSLVAAATTACSSPSGLSDYFFILFVVC